jgi:hypothetical protein
MRCNKSIGYHHLVGSVFRPNNSRWFAVDRSHAWADEEANACASATYLRRGLCPGRYKNQSNPSCVVARGNLQRARLHSNLRAYPYVRPRRRACPLDAGREAKRTGVGTPAHSACQDVRAACLMTCSACCARTKPRCCDCRRLHGSSGRARRVLGFIELCRPVGRPVEGPGSRGGNRSRYGVELGRPASRGVCVPQSLPCLREFG